MKYIHILCFVVVLMLTFNCFSQLNGKATYSVISNINTEDIKDQTARELMEGVNKEISKLEFTLTFNTHGSLFEVNKILEADNANPYHRKIALASCKGNDVWHYSKEEDLRICKLNMFDQEFTIISKPDELRWTMEKESKMTGKHKSYKATTIIKVVGSKGLSERQVIAWYTPEIPVNYGPLGFQNLPGLIMELHMDKVIYQLKSVKFSEDEPKIDLPLLKNSISQEEFYAIADKRIARFRKDQGRE